MVNWFPERRKNDEALIAYVVKSLEDDDGKQLKVLLNISDRDIAILDRRFRLQETYDAIGQHFGLTKERIRQVLLALYGSFRKPEFRVLWDPSYSLLNVSIQSLRKTPVEKTLLTTSTLTSLSRMGIRNISDFLGKSRRFFIEHNIGYVELKEIERELAEFGLSFRTVTGRKKDEIMTF